MRCIIGSIKNTKHHVYGGMSKFDAIVCNEEYSYGGRGMGDLGEMHKFKEIVYRAGMKIPGRPAKETGFTGGSVTNQDFYKTYVFDERCGKGGQGGKGYALGKQKEFKTFLNSNKRTNKTLLETGQLGTEIGQQELFKQSLVLKDETNPLRKQFAKSKGRPQCMTILRGYGFDHHKRTGSLGVATTSKFLENQPGEDAPDMKTANDFNNTFFN
jgi:hypothetical protein